MARKQYWIGSLGPYFFDDEDLLPGQGETRTQAALALEPSAGTTIAAFDEDGRLIEVNLDPEDLIPFALFLAKGDIIVGTTSEEAEVLPVGLNGTILVADSAAVLGVRWAEILHVGGTFEISDPDLSIVVPHSLGFTPNLWDIVITPTNLLGDALKFALTAVNGINFTVDLDQAPGATNSATFVWAFNRFNL